MCTATTKRSQSALGQFPQRHSRKNTSQDFDRKQSRENTRENRSRFRFRGKRYPHNERPRTQSKKAKDKSSHKRYLHKDISTKTSPQMASSCSTEPHNHSQGSNKFIQKGKYKHSHNKTLSSRSRRPLIDFSSAKSTKRINCKKRPNGKGQHSHSHFRTERNVLHSHNQRRSQSALKALSTNAQSALGQLLPATRKDKSRSQFKADRENTSGE